LRQTFVVEPPQVIWDGGEYLALWSLGVWTHPKRSQAPHHQPEHRAQSALGGPSQELLRSDLWADAEVR
jgi:hypothetical protein